MKIVKRRINVFWRKGRRPCRIMISNSHTHFDYTNAIRKHLRRYFISIDVRVEVIGKWITQWTMYCVCTYYALLPTLFRFMLKSFAISIFLFNISATFVDVFPNTAISVLPRSRIKRFLNILRVYISSNIPNFDWHQRNELFIFLRN